MFNQKSQSDRKINNATCATKSAAVVLEPFVNSLRSQRCVATIATGPLSSIDVRICRNKLNSINDRDRHRVACNINQDVTGAACDICKLDHGRLD